MYFGSTGANRATLERNSMRIVQQIVASTKTTYREIIGEISTYDLLAN